MIFVHGFGQLMVIFFITMLWFKCSYPRQTFIIHIFISLAFINSIWWEILFTVHVTPTHAQRSERLLFTLQIDRVGVVAGSICHVSAEGFACVWHVVSRVSVCQQWKGGDWMVKASELPLFGSFMEGTHVSRDTYVVGRHLLLYTHSTWRRNCGWESGNINEAFTLGCTE